MIITSRRSHDRSVHSQCQTDVNAFDGAFTIIDRPYTFTVTMAAAAVGRSMSTLDSIPVLHPTRRRTSVVEVIDVDSEDNEPISVSNGPPSQSQGRSGVPSPDVISVHDSDDDDFYLVPQVVPGSNRTRTGQY